MRIRHYSLHTRSDRSARSALQLAERRRRSCAAEVAQLRWQPERPTAHRANPDLPGLVGARAESQTLMHKLVQHGQHERGVQTPQSEGVQRVPHGGLQSKLDELGPHLRFGCVGRLSLRVASTRSQVGCAAGHSLQPNESAGPPEQIHGSARSACSHGTESSGNPLYSRPLPERRHAEPGIAIGSCGGAQRAARPL